MKATTKKIAVISSILLATLAAYPSVKQALSPKHHDIYDASKIGTGALNEEGSVVVEVNYRDVTYSESVFGMRCYGILIPGHNYYLNGFLFEDSSNKNLAEFALEKDLTLKVLPKEKGESGIFPIPKGVNPAYIPTETSNCPPPLEELVWQSEAKIEHVGQEFWVKTIKEGKDKYFRIKVTDYGSVNKTIKEEYGSPEVTKVNVK
ncbi:hypothetical protein HYU07_02990 [Candidatus Woesearchaeota archaeon]|nr:hypothetical protein [Candidatus Woesearchaeota archaeon]